MSHTIMFTLPVSAAMGAMTDASGSSTPAYLVAGSTMNYEYTGNSVSTVHHADGKTMITNNLNKAFNYINYTIGSSTSSHVNYTLIMSGTESGIPVVNEKTVRDNSGIHNSTYMIPVFIHNNSKNISMVLPITPSTFPLQYFYGPLLVGPAVHTGFTQLVNASYTPANSSYKIYNLTYDKFIKNIVLKTPFGKINAYEYTFSNITKTGFQNPSSYYNNGYEHMTYYNTTSNVTGTMYFSKSTNMLVSFSFLDTWNEKYYHHSYNATKSYYNATGKYTIDNTTTSGNLINTNVIKPIANYTYTIAAIAIIAVALVGVAYYFFVYKKK